MMVRVSPGAALCSLEAVDEMRDFPEEIRIRIVLVEEDLILLVDEVTAKVYFG